MEKQIFTPTYIINSLIGVAIMVFGRFLSFPSIMIPENEKLVKLGFESVDGMIALGVSEVGMTVITLFLGLVYLWTFVDVVWPCFLGVFMLGISDYAPMNQVLNQFLGNPTVVFLVSVFLFISAFTKVQIPVYVARAMLVNKYVRGKPWTFTTMLLLTPFIIALFCTTLGAAFIVWPIYKVIFEVLGYTKEDRFVKVLTVFSIAMILCAFSTDIFKAGGFLLLNGITSNLAANPALEMQTIEYAVYFGFSFIVSLVILAVFILLMRFILKVDVSKLREFDVEILNANPLPPLNAQQYFIIATFVAYMLWLLLPSLLPVDMALTTFLKVNTNGAMYILLAISGFVHFNNKPAGNYVGNVLFNWNSFYLVATSLLYGTAVASPATRISLYLEYNLTALFAGVSYITLILGVIAIGLILTNIFNSVVTGLIMGPILVSLCNGLGYEPAPLIVCFFYSVLFAILTPAGSPFAAMLFANENVTPKEVMSYGLLATVIVMLVTMTFGIPFASFIYS